MRIKLKTTIYLFIISILFLLCLPQYGIAQEYLFDIQHISIKDGLPDRGLVYMVQDNEGYIWVNSINKLFRYDGYEFDIYKNNDFGFPNEDVLDYEIDEDGLVWYRNKVVTASKLRIFNPKTRLWCDISELHQNLLPADFKNEIISLYKEPHLGLIFITQDGRFFTYKDKKIKLLYQHYTSFGIGVDVEMTVYTQMVSDGMDNYWFYNKDTLFHLSPQKKLDYQIVPHHILEIFGAQDKPYIIYGPPISVYNRSRDFCAKVENDTLIPCISSSIEKRFNSFVIDKLGFKWIVIGHKLTYIAPNNEIIFEKSFTDNNETVRFTGNILIDKQLNCWVPTNSGFYKITRRKIPFKKYLKGQSTRGIYKWKDTLMVNGWYSNDNIFLSEIDLKNNKETLNQFPFVNYTFYKDRNNLWIGTNIHAIYRKNLTTNQITTFEKPIESRFILPYRHQKSKKLWIGTQKGLVHLDEQTGIIESFVSQNEALNNSYVYHAYENQQGVWLSTSHGIFLTDEYGNVLKTANQANGFPTDQFNFIHEDKDGIFWVGTRGNGLVRWNIETDEKLIIGRNYGFLNENIYAVYEDDYDFLWLTSDYGLIRFNKETFDVNTYLPEHGLPHEEFNTYSHHQDEAGNLYFGGLNGVISFHPKDIVGLANSDVPLYFKKFKVLKNKDTEMSDVTESVQINNTLTIRTGDKLFEVSFALMDYKGKDKLYGYFFLCNKTKSS